MATEEGTGITYQYSIEDTVTLNVSTKRLTTVDGGNRFQSDTNYCLLRRGIMKDGEYRCRDCLNVGLFLELQLLFHVLTSYVSFPYIVETCIYNKVIVSETKHNSDTCM